MKGKHSKRRLWRGVVIALAAALGCVALVLGGCKKKGDHSHEFGDWQIVKAATCTEDGEKSRKCNGCDETQYETISATGHDYKEVKLVEATCHQSGVKAHLHCENCGDNKLKGVSYTIQELSIPSAHRTVVLDEISPSCDKDGIAEHVYCYECGENFVNDEPKSDEELVLEKRHTLEAVAEVAASCVSGAHGVKAHDRCIWCGKNFIGGEEQSAAQLRIPAEHNYGDMIPATETTRAYCVCKNEGCGRRFTKFSENGKYYEIRRIDLPDSAYTNIEWHEEVPATCTEDGQKGYYSYLRDGVEDWFDIDYSLINDLTIEAEHSYECVAIDQKNHALECLVCGDRLEASGHRFNSGKDEKIDGVMYIRWKCDDCGCESLEYDRSAVADIYFEVPFIVGKHEKNTFPYTFLKQNGLTGKAPLVSGNLQILNWNEVYTEVQAPGVEYPVTKTLKIKCFDFEKDAEVTFDILRTNVTPFFSVYQQGYLNGLGEIGVTVKENFARLDGSEIRYNTIVASKLSGDGIQIVDDGGFDPDADLSGGDKQYTIKFTVDENPTEYEFSFRYTAKRTAVRIESGISDYLTVQGEYPMISVRYTDDSYDWPARNYISLEDFEVVEGSFDVNKVGVQTATFALGAYLRAELNIYVAEPDEIESVYAAGKDDYDIPEYYVEKGADGVAIDVRYYSGKYGVMKLPANVFEALDENGFDLNAEGEYCVSFAVNGIEYSIIVRVYDPADVKAVKFDLDDVKDTEFLYVKKGDEYELTVDYSRLLFTANLTNGEQDWRIPVTAEMISYDKAALKQAIENGESRFKVTFTYKGLVKTITVYIAPEHAGDSISEFLRNGKSASDLIVKDGKLFGEYELIVNGKSGGTYYEKLTESMVFSAEFDSNYAVIESSLKAFDFANAERGAYQFALKFGDMIYAWRSDDLVVVSDEDIEYSFRIDSGAPRYAHIGTKEEVLAEFAGVDFKYAATASFEKDNMRHLLDFESRILAVSEVSVVNLDELDFSKPGEITILFGYKGETYDYTLLLLPDLDLYASKDYTLIPEDGSLIFRLSLYENGYYKQVSSYGDEYCGEYTLIDEENKVYDLDGDLLAENEDGKSLMIWSGEKFGKRHGIQPVTYYFFDYKLYVYLKNGAGYVDVISEHDDGVEYVSSSSAVKLVNGALEMFNEKYSVREEDGKKYLELCVEGNTLYRYENTDSLPDGKVEVRQSVLFNDNNLAYIRFEVRSIPEDGTEFGEWVTQMAYSFEWEREGNMLIIDMDGYEARFEIGADGTLTALDDLD